MGKRQKYTVERLEEINGAALSSEWQDCDRDFFAIVFLLFVPFLVLATTAVFPIETIPMKALCVSAAIASLLIYMGAIIEAKFGLGLRLPHTLCAPLGGLVVVSGFLAGLLQAKSSSSVSWRGRSYSMKDHNQNSISV